MARAIPQSSVAYGCKGVGAIGHDEVQWIKDGDSITQARRLKGYSGRELARVLSVSPVDLSQMEHGRIKPDLDLIPRILALPHYDTVDW